MNPLDQLKTKILQEQHLGLQDHCLMDTSMKQDVVIIGVVVYRFSGEVLVSEPSKEYRFRWSGNEYELDIPGRD